MAKTAEQAEAPEAAPEVAQDGPLLDMSDAAVKKMIKAAKSRGFVTYDELNKVLPSEEFSSEQIEDTLSMLSEMGINVVENDEAEEQADSDGERDAETEGDDEEPATGKAVATTTTTSTALDRTDDPVRMYLREMGSVELCRAKAKSPSPSASRRRETMIAGLSKAR